MNTSRFLNELSRRQFIARCAKITIGTLGISAAGAFPTLGNIKREHENCQTENPLSCLREKMAEANLIGIRSQNDDISGFHRFRFPQNEETGRIIFSIGSNGPPILLLHELPGLTPACADLACRLAKHGFKVYIPLLFGDPLQDSRSDSFLSFLGLAFGSDFSLFEDEAHHPVMDWLDEFYNEILAREGNAPIGVIGMCLTGSFPIALLKYSNVKAVLLSQPALPLYSRWFSSESKKQALGLTKRDVLLAQERLAREQAQIRIMALRFSNDCLCPTERFEKLRKEFGSHFMSLEIPSPDTGNCINDDAHAVLTIEFRDIPNHPTNLAFTKAVEFLKSKLA